MAEHQARTWTTRTRTSDLDEDEDEDAGGEPGRATWARPRRRLAWPASHVGRLLTCSGPSAHRGHPGQLGPRSRAPAPGSCSTSSQHPVPPPAGTGPRSPVEKDIGSALSPGPVPRRPWVPKQRSRQPPTTNPKTLTNQSDFVSPATFTFRPASHWPQPRARLAPRRALSPCRSPRLELSPLPHPWAELPPRARPPPTQGHLQDPGPPDTRPPGDGLQPGRVTTTASAMWAGWCGSRVPSGAGAVAPGLSGLALALTRPRFTSQASRQKPS